MNLKKYWILIALAAFVVGACNGSTDAPPSEQSDQASEAQQETTAAVDSDGLMAKTQEIPDIQGKPGAPVDIRYALMGTPAVGEPLEIRIDIIARSPAGRVDVSINTVGELDVDASARGWSLQNPEPGAPNRKIITTTPRGEGLYYINVEAMVETDGSRQSKVYSIPVLVGDKLIRAQTDKAEISMDEDGNPIVIMHSDDGT